MASLTAMAWVTNREMSVRIESQLPSEWLLLIYCDKQNDADINQGKKKKEKKN